MTLFVVVQRSKHSGVEYLALESDAEGFTEYAAAADAANEVRDNAFNDSFEIYVGKVVPVDEEGQK